MATLGKVGTVTTDVAAWLVGDWGCAGGLTGQAIIMAVSKAAEALSGRLTTSVTPCALISLRTSRA